MVSHKMLQEVNTKERQCEINLWKQKKKDYEAKDV